MFRQKMKIGTLLQDVAIAVSVEQFGAKEFFSNYAGWTRNDINALQACTTKSQYDALMQRLTMSEPKYNVKEGTKVIDALKSAIPRWCQSPNELMSYAEQIGQGALESMDDAYREALKAPDKASDSKVESETEQDA